MIGQDDIKSLVQEWFTDCTTITETALLYGELYHELQVRLKERMNELDGSNQNEQD
jgi:hypothetical protein